MANPGWYDDGHGAVRWWDGNGWTEHVADAAPPQVAPQAPAEVVTAPAGGGSKLWILWVALGVLFVGILVAVIVVASILIGQATSGSGAAPLPSATLSADDDASAQPDDGPTDDEARAVAAVQLYNEAWLGSNCDYYFGSTTENFRELLELPDCETFEAEARRFIGSVDDYEVLIGDVEVGADAISVSTTESYTSAYDDEGNLTDQPLDYVDRYEYIVVNAGDEWLVDDIFQE